MRIINRKSRIFENLERRHLLASDWQNASLVRDVDDSSLVTAHDVLLLINQLNSHGSHDLPTRMPQSSEPFYDVSGDDCLTPLDVLLVIDAINEIGDRQPTIVGALAPSSDPNNNGIVLTSKVTIRGQTQPGAIVTLTQESNEPINHSVIADNIGAFQFEIDVAKGLQTVRLSSRDELGRVSEESLDIKLGNTIQDWNASVLDVIRQWTTTSNDPYQGRIVTAQPPLVARNLAMIHAAMFDAANAVVGTYESYRAELPPQPGVSAEAAAAAAGFEVAKALYSAADEVAVWQASLNETLAQVPDGIAKTAGLELGRSIGRTILADRTNDGVKSTSDYKPTGEVAKWRRTFADYLPPLLPQWPGVKPFALTSGDELRPVAPPTLDSVEYAAAVDEVMRLGGLNSQERTAEQTEIALFWADGGGTATPPGHWNRIASDVTLIQQLDLVDTARTFALMNIAMADAGIASWDAKYHYDLWRPIDAIRQADSDGNSATTSDTNWIPLLKTPPFPSYTSGHSTFSGAASAVLTRLFGESFAFESQSDGHLAPEQRPLDPSQIVTRRFSSFAQAAEEAGRSRIYGGIHYSFDDTAGRNLGDQIGRAVMNRLS